MELWLNNIGIIKKTAIRIDGLTVITGKNSSGKTTIGKVLYAVTQANSDIENAFDQSKSAYIQTMLRGIWHVLSARRTYPIRPLQAIRDYSQVEQVLFVLSRSAYSNASMDQLRTWLDIVRQVLPKITMKEYVSFIEKFYPSNDREYLRALSDQFDERKNTAIDLCDKAIATIEDPEAFNSFRCDRTRAFLNFEFHDQIKPVKANRTIGQIRMYDSDNTIMGIKIRNKSNIEFSEDSSFIIPYNRAVFVDNPFVLDHFEMDDYYFRASSNEFDDQLINVVDMLSHEDHLKKLLRTKATVNFFENLDFQKNYHEIFEKINQIVPGEFQESNDGMFYVESGTKLHVQNLATGSKLFFIIKLLFMNGYLNKETVLVLDEPESHLHPEWVNKFAEILVLLIKEIGIHVVLTTHSPNLMLALDVCAREYRIEAISHFYIADVPLHDWHATIKCVDGRINEVYAHLSRPLIEMSIKQEALEGSKL